MFYIYGHGFCVEYLVIIFQENLEPSIKLKDNGHRKQPRFLHSRRNLTLKSSVSHTAAFILQGASYYTWRVAIGSTVDSTGSMCHRES